MNLLDKDAAKNNKDYNAPWKVAKRSLESCDNAGSIKNLCHLYYADCEDSAVSPTLGEFRLPAAKMSYVVDTIESADEDDSSASCKAYLKRPAEQTKQKVVKPPFKPKPLDSHSLDTSAESNTLTPEEINIPLAKPKPAMADLVDEDTSQLYLHQMVATDQPGTTENYMKVFELYLDESDAHELNEKDARGRTALHLAVQFSNVEAIAALLMCGADVNVADHQNKSPFTYCLDSYDMPNYKCNQMFFTFLGHVHKLVVIGLRVSAENRRCYARARSRHVFNDKQLQLSYAIELDKMEDVRLSYCTSLRDVLYQSADKIATSMLKRRTLEDVLTSSDFYKEFPKLCCLLKLQYRRGVTRYKLMQPVKAALELIAGQGLPDPCSETIIRHLDDDEDLMSLMKISVEARDKSAS
ncbi:uncharacterized protein LOC103315512 [Nasonia vitripennis]|uniref:Uncharacterized protein n=1 Tax=Nasonia vitripennis TaxID=7425 RepID=A0A7M7H2P8_NASVI|nr:uncharacterized protein LOC103315512 [Nasonia vitripennis]